MATIYNHIRTSTIDDNGNVDVLYPETTGADVSVDRSNNNKIPAVATDAQALANNLSSSAFESPIDDTVTGASNAWSSDKINTRAGNVDLKVGADNGLHFTNSVGEDYILDLTKAVGTATTAQVLSGYTFSNASKLGLNGAMTNNGQVVYTLNPGETQTIAQGYHDGTGYVTVPENTGTYTYAVNTTGATVDLGATNTYRYVNAENVYNYGLAQGTTVHTGTYTLTEEDFDSTVDMGVDHSYRYISVPVGGTAEFVTGTVSGYGNNLCKISLGFRPDFMLGQYSNGRKELFGLPFVSDGYYYNIDGDKGTYPIGSYNIQSVDDDGFTIIGHSVSSGSYTFTYVAGKYE